MVLRRTAGTHRKPAMFFFKKWKPKAQAKAKPVAERAVAGNAEPGEAQKRGTYRANVNLPAFYSVAGRPGLRLPGNRLERRRLPARRR